MAETNERVSVPSAAHDLSDAVLADPAATDAWRRLEPGLKASYIAWVEDTADVEERGARITRLVVELSDGTALYDDSDLAREAAMSNATSAGA